MPVEGEPPGRPSQDGTHGPDTNRVAAPQTDFERPVHALLGLPFDAVTSAEAVTRIRAAADRRVRCFVSTPNLNFVVGCLADAAFRGSVLRSDLSLPDGMPLVWAARALRIPLGERVSGSTLFDRLREGAGDAGRRALRVYFFGGPEGSAAAAHEAINRTPGGMSSVGFHNPGFGSMEAMSTPEVVAAINATDADFLVVALGAKKGQRWIEHNLPSLTVPVVSYLGAVVNFVAGRMRRAPPRWQRLGLEWLWRIRQEPALWRRYAADGIALIGLLLTRILPAAIDVRLNRPDARAIADATVVSETGDDGTVVIALRGPCVAANAAGLRAALASATRVARPIAIDLVAVGWIDSACIGLLLLVAGHPSKVGRPLVLQRASPATRRRLRLACADFLFDDPR